MATTTLHSAPSSVLFTNNLRQAEAVRKKIILNYSVIGTVLFIGLIIEAVTWMSIAVAVIALFVLVYINWYGIPISRFEQLYIRAVTGHAIEGYPWLSVDYQSHMKASELISAGWIWDTPDYFSGKNLIYGEHAGLTLRISEVYLKAQPPQGLCSANGTCNGLMMQAHIPQMESRGLHLVTDPALLQRPNNAEEYERVVIGSGDGDGLSGHPGYVQELTRALRDFHQMSGLPLVASLKGNQLSCAILLPEHFHYFRPRLTKTVFYMEPVTRFDRDLQFLTNTALQMSENTRRG